MNNLSNYVSTRLQSNIYGERSIEIYGSAYFVAKNMDNGIDNLLIDPKLIEIGIGVKFTELDKERD